MYCIYNKVGNKKVNIAVNSTITYEGSLTKTLINSEKRRTSGKENIKLKIISIGLWKSKNLKAKINVWKSPRLKKRSRANSKNENPTSLFL